MASKPTTDELRRTIKGHGGRADAVEAENPAVYCVVDGQKRFGAALSMALSRMPVQKGIQSSVATIKTVSIMSLGDRLLMPRGNGLGHSGKAQAACISLALGTGGFSSNSSTCKLSRSVSFSLSDWSISVLAAANACRNTKPQGNFVADLQALMTVSNDDRNFHAIPAGVIFLRPDHTRKPIRSSDRNI